MSAAGRSPPSLAPCAVSPWVETTIASGYSLQFKVHPPSFPQCDIYSCGEAGGNGIEERNKQLVEQKSNMSFGCKQRMVQPLFGCSKERGRTPSYSRSSSVKQIPKKLQIQDINIQTASEPHKPRRWFYYDRSQLSRRDTPTPPAVTEICVRRHSLPILGSAVRPFACSLNTHPLCLGSIGSASLLVWMIGV